MKYLYHVIAIKDRAIESDEKYINSPDCHIVHSCYQFASSLHEAASLVKINHLDNKDYDSIQVSFVREYD